MWDISTMWTQIDVQEIIYFALAIIHSGTNILV